MSGVSKRVVEQQFWRMDPWPRGPGFLGLLEREMLLKEESPAGLFEPHL